MTVSDNYPIIERRILTPVVRKGLRGALFGAKREPSELPDPQPGTTFVIETNGKYESIPPRYFRGDEVGILDANSVSIVDLTLGKIITASVAIPSLSGAADFEVRISIACSVTSPAEVVRHSIMNLDRRLESYVRREARLHEVGQRYDISDVIAARNFVHARVSACVQLRPLEVPGVAIELSQLELLTPDDIRRTARDKLDEAHRQVMANLRNDHTVKKAEQLELIGARGPEALEALAVALDEMKTVDAAQRAFHDRDQLDERRLALLQLLAENHQMDRVPLDVVRLYDETLNNLVGNQVGSGKSGDRVQLDAGGPPPVDFTAAGPRAAGERPAADSGEPDSQPSDLPLEDFQ